MYHAEEPRSAARIGAAEQRVADYMDAKGQDVLSMSVADIASSCGVSEATVVRHCRRAGHTGLKEYKIALANHGGHAKVSPITGNESVSELKQKIFSGCAETLHTSCKLLSDRMLSTALDVLTHADNIDVYAVGGSIPIASYLRHQFIKLGIRTNVYSDSYTMRMSQSQLKSGDVVLAISCSGKTTEVVEAMRTAKTLGAHTICITTGADSPLAQLADIALLTANERFITVEDSIYGRMSNLITVDILFAGLAIRKKNQMEAEKK